MNERVQGGKRVETQEQDPERVLAQYERHFSALGAFQAEHSLRYALRQTRGGALQLSVSDAAGQSLLTLPAGRTAALQLLTYLYENAIPKENWQDVIGELLTEAGCKGDVGTA